MTVSTAMRRLLRIRHLEEEQRRLALESAAGELSLLEHALDSTHRREACGRRLIASSASMDDSASRAAALEESCSASRHATFLDAKIEDAREEVEDLRALFLESRVERRQAETLIDEAVRQQAIEADRLAQQTLDDLFGLRKHRNNLRDE